MAMKLPAFAKEMTRLGREFQRAADKGLGERFESRALKAVRAQSPEGNPRDRRRPLLLKRSWEAISSGYGAGSIAPHGAILDFGRKFSAKAKRVLGSTQAPEGISRPVARSLERDLGKQVERSVGTVFG